MKIEKHITRDILDESLNILVVEDDDGLRRLIQKRLERKKFSVEAIGRGEDAITRLKKDPNVILLLDYKLPDMTGRELIENLVEYGYTIPFVIITGHGDERIAVEMMKLGARDYLVKDQSLLEVLPQVMGQISTQILTEKKLLQVKKALHESEERFRMLFNRGTDAIFVQEIKDGKAGNFIEVNDITSHRLGYSRKELLRMSMKNIEIPAATSTQESASPPEMTPAQKHINLYEAIQVTKSGKHICVENHSHLIELDEKPAILCISRDITQRMHLEEQLRQAQKMEAIGKLAGGVAHDFNNLLTAIMGYSELILGKMASDNPFRESLEEIKRAGKRAASLTQQLLAFSRKQVLKPKILDLNHIVKSMERMLERIIGEDIRLISRLDPELNKLKADASQLEQIILNLTVNAVDAMPKGGNLIIQTENMLVNNPDNTLSSYSIQDHYVKLSISDSGDGIDKKVIPQIFEPFFTTKTNGTGLGLSVVYGIVKQHNGWVKVNSQLGGGSTFEVYFPALATCEEVSIEKELSLTEFGGNGETILIIEDEAGVREISAKALRDYGYKVIEAVTAWDAFGILKKENGNIQLVISDIVLPDQGGIELTEDIRSLYPNIKTLLTSGYADHRSHWTDVIKKGIPFLQKPYSMVDLLKSVKEIIDLETSSASEDLGTQETEI